MASEWQELTDLTRDRAFRVQRVRLVGSEVAIEGDFEPPTLARLPAEDQAFGVGRATQVLVTLREIWPVPF